ncbi:MAG: recombinase family protein [Clostridia bacterium]|nr:recombinase family protein [Clostridia bacterium]
MAKYFSVRVSSKDQNLARQLAEAQKYGIPKENIFCDKITGRKKDRPEYERMKSLLKRGDEVYFKELDRIGRAKYLIKDELEWFKERGVIVRILDIPTTLMEVPKGQEWVFEMVHNILIEVLATIAEQEWEKTKKRQSEGIASMPIVNGRRVSAKTGRGFGRERKCPDNFEEVYNRQQSGEVSMKEALQLVGVGRTRWYELVKENRCRA